MKKIDTLVGINMQSVLFLFDGICSVFWTVIRFELIVTDKYVGIFYLMLVGHVSY